MTTRESTSKRSTLIKLKQWLTVEEAARHLARVFEEEVTEADIFHLAVVRRLTLSVRFANRPTGIQLTGYDTWTQVDEDEWEKGEPCPRGEFVVLPNDVYDLPMIGVERLEVEREYRRHAGGADGASPGEVPSGGDGPFVKGWLTGAQFRLQRKAGEANINPVYESGRYLLPDTVFVVRPGALEKLIQQVSPPAAGPDPNLPTAPTPEQTAAQPAKTSPPFDIAEHDLDTREGRRNAVDAFLEHCNSEQAHVLKRNHIWRAARYQQPRSFQDWQAMTPKATRLCDENIRRILAMSATDFLNLLSRKVLSKTSD